MNNREIYQIDPSKRKIKNEGVVSLNDDDKEVLRYELETFVCDGQYEKGLEHILETYLMNIVETQQPAVWVSGFYGSGKSHLVKMLRALWEDTPFEDGATARGIAKLSQSINDLLKELTTQAKRHGGLHAASGSLGAGRSGSVRLALLSIIFKSADLPEQYHVSRFVLWLKSLDIYETVRGYVERNGCTWQEELDNFYVAEGLHKALIQAKPDLFSSPMACVETLNNLFPFVPDISSDDMVKAIRQALTKESVFPLTIVVLDEVQAYIGENSQRSEDVKEAVEACCKNFGGKLLFIGCGQTAMSGTSNLKKLEGRFTIRVELSDADVDAVIRKVLLAKKADADSSVEQMMQTNMGEISRHLSGTTIGHRQDDIPYFVKDYPILPVRRRFWENTRHVLDKTGTDSQLRNQLSMVHKAIMTNLDESLGHVVPADYLYFDSANGMLQSRTLPKNVHEKTMSWRKGSEDERLTARACGLVFLINKLADSNVEIGIKATVDTLADLMVEDLSQGSSSLRGKLPGLLKKCELLIRVEDEYRIQTPESAAWYDDFLSQCNRLANVVGPIDNERQDRIHRKFGELVKKLSLTHGTSMETRDISPVFEAKLPLDHDNKIYVWIRDGWSIEENSVRVDALQAGNQSPTIFVFIPKRSANDLRHYLIDYKAAKATLEMRGVPNTPEGIEARAAIETIRQSAEGKIAVLLDEAFSGAHLFQSGGNEIIGNDLQDMVLEAAGNSLQRLYPQFYMADHAGWEKVYSRAKQGGPDALKAVGDEGEPGNNQVCKAILGFIAGGKNGTDIRNRFEASPYGWPRDAVDGGLQVLLVAGLVRAQDERGKIVDPRELERKAIGKAMFKVESTNVTSPMRIEIRKLLQKVHIQFKSGEELVSVPQFLQKMMILAESAGGDAPKPAQPDTTLLKSIRLAAGNEQLLALYNNRDELSLAFDGWTDLNSHIEKVWPIWEKLRVLLEHASDLKSDQEVRQQAETIERQRMLLHDPDLVQPLLKSLEDTLRKELVVYNQRYGIELDSQTAQLEADSSWQKLPEVKRTEFRQSCGITPAPDLSVGTLEDLIKALQKHPLKVWKDRIDALPVRFACAREMAAKELEPKAQTVNVPRRTLKTRDEIDAWVKEVTDQLNYALTKGPVVIR